MSRCHSYEAQVRDFYKQLVVDSWKWLCSHRFWCFNLAFVFAMMQPLAIVNAQVVSPPTSPPYLRPIAPVTPIQAPQLPEVAQLPDIPPPAPTPVIEAPTLVYTPPPSICQTYFSGDYYLDNIIRYESGGNSCATNYLGCFGLLQACPGEPLRTACGGDPACQIQWFIDNKAGGRSWAQIWQHELDFGWW